jgi:hypothetical protein
MNPEQQLSALYSAFNARDLDVVLEAMAEDVDWPNAWEGGRLHGRTAVRGYWTRQWGELDPHVEPVAFTTRADGCVAVDVYQVVRSLDGDLLGEGRVVHIYELHDGLVTKMDVEEPSAGG